tara:strand:+ start:5150 stop:5923 length:774 start_codon:yes stop_codon:yes gene_type:complete
MKNKFHNYILDNINSSIFQFKFLFFFQWFIITFWWRLWKYNDQIIKVPIYFESFLSNQYVHYSVYIIYSLSVFLVFLNKKFFIGISFGLVFFIISDFFTYHHDIYSMLILSLACFFCINKHFFYVGFISSMYIMSSISKMNSLFIDGELISLLFETEFKIALSKNFSILLSYLTIVFEFFAGLIIYLGRKNFFIIISFILFHFFMGIFLGRGVVFNLLFILLITEIFKDHISNKWYWLYAFLGSFIMSLKIILGKFF